VAARGQDQAALALRSLDGGTPFALAALWEAWYGPGEDKPPLESCTIITTEPNDLASRFHDRMPVILHPDDYDDWLRGD
jgi:putative SOS response-associated peptidase YedK